MKVKLLKTEIPNESVNNLPAYLNSDSEYIVYALLFSKEQYVAIADDSGGKSSYPVWMRLRDFEITDNKLPEDWVYGAQKKDMPGTIFSIKEWAESDGGFYYWLIEGRANEVKKYDELKLRHH